MGTGWMPPILKGFLVVNEPQEVSYQFNQAGYYYLNDSRDVVYVNDSLFHTFQIEILSEWDAKVFNYSGGLGGSTGSIPLVIFLDADQNILTYHQVLRIYDLSVNIPSRAKYIRFPISNSQTSFISELSISVPERYDVTDNVMNWDNLNVALDRDNLSGTFVEVEQALQITGQGQEILNSLLMGKGLHANAIFEVHRRDNFDLNKYTVVHSAQLDFSTYAENEDYVEIEAEMRNFNAMVASFGSLNYDIPVSKLETETWTYRHNEMINVGNWTIPEIQKDFPLRTEGSSFYYRPLMNLDKAEMVPNGVENDMKSQSSGENITGDYFFESVAVQAVRIKINFNYSRRMYVNPNQSGFRMSVISSTGISTERITRSFASIDETYLGFGVNTGTLSINEEISLNIGDKLVFYIYALMTDSEPGYFRVDQFENFSVSYKDITKRTELISIIKPEALLNKLLESMGEGFREYTGQIVWKDKPFRTMLAAAESIRGFGNAFFHVNFNDFMDWMQFMGYEWDVDESTGVLTYRERDYYFNPSITAMELKENELAGLLVEADDTHAWSAVRIGYDTPDYENTNGRFEPNGTYEYATDYEGAKMQESVLDLISPFRADPVGIEILTWSRSAKTTDTDSDNDVFMVAIDKNLNSSGEKVEYRGVQIRARNESENFEIQLFNAYFNPYFMVLENESKFGINAKTMRFAGTDLNRDIAIVGASVKPQSNISITKGLFKPMLYQFAAGTHLDLPQGDARRGLVYFRWQGKTLKGYVNQLVKNYCLDMETNWWLHVV